MTDIHAIEQRLRDLKPSIQPPRLVGDVTYALHDTPVGPLLLAVSPRGLVASSYESESTVARRIAARVSPAVVRGTSGALDEVRRELDAYFAGRRQAFDLPVDLALATPFQGRVLGALRESVGYGSTTTYGSLARQVGAPKAARAVGAALGANPVCVVVPCHRVIGATGALTGYAGGVVGEGDAAAPRGCSRVIHRRAP